MGRPSLVLLVALPLLSGFSGLEKSCTEMSEQEIFGYLSENKFVGRKMRELKAEFVSSRVDWPGTEIEVAIVTARTPDGYFEAHVSPECNISLLAVSSEIRLPPQ